MARKRRKPDFGGTDGIQYFPEFVSDWKAEEKERIKKIYASLPRFQDPKNDDERLLNLQSEFRREGKESALSEMLRLAFPVAMKCIRREARKNGKVRALDYPAMVDKATDAVSYILAAFSDFPDFVIAKSFTAYIYLRVKKELYYHKKSDELVEFVDADALNSAADRNAGEDFTDRLVGVLDSKDASEYEAYYSQF